MCIPWHIFYFLHLILSLPLFYFGNESLTKRFKHIRYQNRYHTQGPLYVPNFDTKTTLVHNKSSGFQQTLVDVFCIVAS